MLAVGRGVSRNSTIPLRFFTQHPDPATMPSRLSCREGELGRLGRCQPPPPNAYVAERAFTTLLAHRLRPAFVKAPPLPGLQLSKHLRATRWPVDGDAVHLLGLAEPNEQAALA